jgi:uncharacterized membrane protein YphA (DoxX/SURF4 family)
VLKPLHPSKPESAFLLVLRVALAGLFFFSAWMKLSPANVMGLGPLPGMHFFAQAVRSFELVPESLVPIVTYAIPWTEALVALCLLLGITSRSAGLLGFLLLLSFTVGIASVILRGMNISCGCFGRYKLICEGPAGWCKVGENLVLMSMFWIVARRGGGRYGFDKGWLD